MGIALEKEESKEIVHHRSLLGYCWNGREESRLEAMEKARWEQLRPQLEKEALEQLGREAPLPPLATRKLWPGTTSLQLFPSKWIGMSTSTMLLKTGTTCFSLPSLKADVVNRSEHQKNEEEAAGPSGEENPPTTALHATPSHPLPSLLTQVPSSSPINASFASAATAGGGPSTAATAPRRPLLLQRRAAAALGRLKPGSDKFDHVALHSAHPYLAHYHLGILRDVYFQLAPAQPLGVYHRANLCGFPHYFLMPIQPPPVREPHVVTSSGGGGAEPSVVHPPLSSSPLHNDEHVPQPLEANTLTAALLAASHGFDASTHASDLGRLFPPTPSSWHYRMEPRSLSSSKAVPPSASGGRPRETSPAATSVVLFRISALELLLMPPEAEVELGNGCLISLEDERRRVIEVVQLLAERLEHQTAYRLPPELSGNEALQALQVPWATHLRDFEERSDDLRVKRYFERKMKEHRDVQQDIEDGGAGAAPKKAHRLKKRKNHSVLQRGYEEYWFAYQFLIAAVPLYECGFQPSAYHQLTTVKKPVSLHLRHPISRKHSGVGCVTAIRYGGLMVLECRARVRREDVGWVKHFVSLIPERPQGSDTPSDPLLRRSTSPGVATRLPTTTAAVQKQEDARKSGGPVHRPHDEEDPLENQVRTNTLTRAASMIDFLPSPAARSVSGLDPVPPPQRRRYSAVPLTPLRRSPSHRQREPLSEGEECLLAYQRSFFPVWEWSVSVERRLKKQLQQCGDYSVITSYSRHGARIRRLKRKIDRQEQRARELRRRFSDPPSHVARSTRARTPPSSSSSDCSLDSSSESASSSSDDGSTVPQGKGRSARSSRRPSDLAYHQKDDARNSMAQKRRASTVSTTAKAKQQEQKSNKKEAPSRSSYYLPPNRLIRGAIRQIGGIKFFNLDYALGEGVELSTLLSGVENWLRHLHDEAPIRARPLSLFLQRYEGIAQAIRVGAGEDELIQLHGVISAPNREGGTNLSFFNGSVQNQSMAASFNSYPSPVMGGNDGRMSFAAVPLTNVTFNGSFRGGVDDGAGALGEKQDTVEGAGRGTEPLTALARVGGYVRGFPVLAGYTGALDPIVEPLLTPALDTMFWFHRLFDPATSTFLLTEKRALREQSRLGEPLYYPQPNCDPEWLQANAVVQLLQSEYEEIQDLHRQAKAEMVARQEEYYRLAGLFLPLTEIDEVTPGIVFIKALRHCSEYVPLKELNHDWLSNMQALLLVSYEDMFLLKDNIITTPSEAKDEVSSAAGVKTVARQPTGTSLSRSAPAVGASGGFDLPTDCSRYATYFPTDKDLSLIGNYPFLTVCDANRSRWLQEGGLEGQWSERTPTNPFSPPFPSRPMVSYRLVSVPPAVQPRFLHPQPQSLSPSCDPHPTQEIVIAPSWDAAGGRGGCGTAGSRLTGGSLGLFAGLLAVHAAKLTARLLPLLLLDNVSAEERRIKWKNHMWLQRVTLWGARDSEWHVHRRGSCTWCCGGDEKDVVSRDGRGSAPDLSPMSSHGTPTSLGGAGMTLPYGVDPRSPGTTSPPYHLPSHDSALGMVDRPFTENEFFSLFDAMAFYVRTCRRILRIRALLHTLQLSDWVNVTWMALPSQRCGEAAALENPLAFSLELCVGGNYYYQRYLSKQPPAEGPRATEDKWARPYTGGQELKRGWSDRLFCRHRGDYLLHSHADKLFKALQAALAEWHRSKEEFYRSNTRRKQEWTEETQYLVQRFPVPRLRDRLEQLLETAHAGEDAEEWRTMIILSRA